MKKGLPGFQIAGIDVTGGIPLVDARDLVGEKSVAAEAVIDAGRPDIDNWDRPMLPCINLSASILEARYGRSVCSGESSLITSPSRAALCASIELAKMNCSTSND